MKKKLLSVILGLTLVVSTLSGCSSKSTETDTTGTVTPTEAAESGISSVGTTEMDVQGDDVTTINVWTFIALHQEFYTKMAEKWNEQHPDKKVKLVLSNMQYDDMHNKLSLALESGEGAPDVVDIEVSKFPAFTTGTVGLRDLTDVIAPYKDSVVEARLNLYSKDGKYYGLPTHVGATVAFYNDDLLQAAGINYEDIKTWDDFKAAGVKYFEATGKYFATVETTAQWMTGLMLVQKGGNYLDADGNLAVNNDKMVEVLTYIKGMQDTGAFGIIPGGQPDSDEAYAAFNAGDYAVQIMPFWQTSRFVNYMADIKGKVKIAPTPVWSTTDGEVQSIGGGGTGTAIIASGPNADLAAEVMAFIKLSPEANKEVWNILGFDPVNKEVWTDTALTQNPDNQFVQYFKNYPFDTLNAIKDNIGLLSCQTDEKWPSINNEFCTVTLTNIFENGMDIKEALDESQATLENEFQ